MKTFQDYLEVAVNENEDSSLKQKLRQFCKKYGVQEISQFIDDFMHGLNNVRAVINDDDSVSDSRGMDDRDDEAFEQVDSLLREYSFGDEDDEESASEELFDLFVQWA